ncbi:MAG TPA: hypothetical protein VG603_00640 [Chitinophagales bacterium]|nr:hypothetical protein [Chitinophagales bacterium]
MQSARAALINLLIAAFLITALVWGLKPTHKELIFAGTGIRDTLVTAKFSPGAGLSAVFTNNDSVGYAFYVTPAGYNFYSDSDIVRSVLKSATTPEQKAMALWRFMTNWTRHAATPSFTIQEKYNPVMMVNCFEGGFCDDRNAALANLATVAGFQSRVYHLRGHIVAEIFYDNAWHMFDADKGLYYLSPNGTVASVEYLHQHPETIAAKTKELKGIVPRLQNRLSAHALAGNVWVSDYYQYTYRGCNMRLYLNPGETLQFEVTPAGTLANLINAEINPGSGPLYQRSGKYFAHTSWQQLNADSVGMYYRRYFPFPVQQFTIGMDSGGASVPVAVYYSSDNQHWYYKGVIAGYSKLSFSTFSTDGSNFTFIYNIRFVPLALTEYNFNPAISIETGFTFSDKLFFNNPRQAFEIRPVDAVGSVGVKVWQMQ